jgi:hypothetical protein
MCPITGACSRALAPGGTPRQTVRPRQCAGAVESDEGADLARRDTIGPRAELDSFNPALGFPGTARRHIPIGPRGVSGREERSAADRRRVLAKWRPAPGGGKRSDEARPSLRACVPFRIAPARRRPGARWVALRAGPWSGFVALLSHREGRRFFPA